MGITCKPSGKFKRVFKRMENKLMEDKMAQKSKKKDGK